MFWVLGGVWVHFVAVVLCHLLVQDMSVAKPVCPWGFLDTSSLAKSLSQHHKLHPKGKSVVKSFA